MRKPDFICRSTDPGPHLGRSRDTAEVDPLCAALDDLAADLVLVLPDVDDPLARDRLVLVANSLRNLAAKDLQKPAARPPSVRV